MCAIGYYAHVVVLRHIANDEEDYKELKYTDKIGYRVI